MKVFSHFVLGVLLFWTLVVGFTFVAALFGFQPAQVHLVDMLVLALVVPVVGSMIPAVRRQVILLGRSVSPIGVNTNPFSDR